MSLVRCAHRVHLDSTGDPSQRIRTSAFLQLLWESGRAHEEAVVGGLDVAVLKDDLEPERRVDETRRLMELGAWLIYHGRLEAGDLVGEPDILQRVDHLSSLGAFAYVPTEIKSGKAFEDGKEPRPKKHYLIQLCAYAELLEAVQGWRPENGRIIDGDGEMQTLDLRGFWPAYESARERLRRVLSGAEQTTPGWKPACGLCAWQAHCWKVLSESGDLTTVAGVGESFRDKLSGLGLRTVADLAKVRPEELLSVKGIGASRARVWTRQARVQKKGKPLIIGGWSPPAVAFEISYDIEDFTPDPFV